MTHDPQPTSPLVTLWSVDYYAYMYTDKPVLLGVTCFCLWFACCYLHGDAAVHVSGMQISVPVP